jgi:hypothetical protein
MEVHITPEQRENVKWQLRRTELTRRVPADNYARLLVADVT